MKEKNVAAMLTLVAGDVATVIVPLANDVVIGAEKTSVLTPLVPDPLVLSASLVYVLPALSVTAMPAAVGSTAMATNTVLPAATLIAV